jgi:hypothetical protein
MGIAQAKIQLSKEALCPKLLILLSENKIFMISEKQ